MNELSAFHEKSAKLYENRIMAIYAEMAQSDSAKVEELNAQVQPIIKEYFDEVFFHLNRNNIITWIIIGKAGKDIHNLKCIIPKGVDFYWLAMSWCDSLSMNSNIHPGNLIFTAACEKEEVIRHMNIMFCACDIVGNNRFQGRVDGLNKSEVIGIKQILIARMNKPK